MRFGLVVIGIFIIGFGIYRWISMGEDRREPISPQSSTAVLAPVCGPTSPECASPLAAATPLIQPVGAPQGMDGLNEKQKEWRAKVRRARELVHEKRKEAAISILEEVLRESPTHESALMELAPLIEKEPNQRARAMELYERAIKKNPENELALEEYARMKNEEGPKVASDAMEELSRQYPESVTVALMHGKVLLQEGNPKAAIVYLERVVQSGREVESAYFPLAEAYRQTGDSKKAAEYQAKVVKAQEKFNEQHRRVEALEGQMTNELFNQKLTLARTFLKSGEKEKAERLLLELGKERPQNQELLRLLEALRTK